MQAEKFRKDAIRDWDAKGHNKNWVIFTLGPDTFESLDGVRRVRPDTHADPEKGSELCQCNGDDESVMMMMSQWVP
jgi:hypothetical protein